MKIIKQLYPGQDDFLGANGDAGTDTSSQQQAQGTPAPGIIATANGVPDYQVLNQNSFMNQMPQGMTPQMQQMYQQAQQGGGAHEALSPTDYYPTLNHQIGVGNYSGSEIGSTTLFAPAGAVMPIGMMDARDAAMQKAALAKHKENEDFKAKEYKNPETKLVNVQDKLTDEHNDFIKNSWSKALKQSGGNPKMAQQMLDTDRDFQGREQSYQDHAKFGDALAKQIADEDEAVKTGKFVMTPSHKEARNNVLAVADPEHPDFKKFGNAYRKLRVESDLSNDINEYTKQMHMNETGNAYNRDSGEFISSWKNSLKNYSPQQKQGLKDRLRQIHDGSDYFTPEKTDKAAEDFLSTVQQERSGSVHMKPQGSGNKPYQDVVPQTSGSINQTIPNTTAPGGVVGAGTRPVGMKNVYNTSAEDQKKELTFPLGPDVESLDGYEYKNESGYVKGQVPYVASVPYYTNEKRYLRPEEIEALERNGNSNKNPDLEWRPRAVVNVTPKTNDKGKIGKSENVFINTNQVKGKFGKEFDEVINKVEEDSKQRNVDKFLSPNGEMKRKTKDGKIAIFDANKKFLRYE